MLDRGANPNLKDNSGKTALFYAQQKGHEGTAGLLQTVTASENTKLEEQKLNPSLSYPDIESFQKAIGEEACLLKDKHIYFFAPKARESEAKIVFPYLVKAYDALHAITGMDTQYIIVVYNFSKGHKDAFGGTSNCTLWYDDSNLRLDEHEEWQKYKIPHVSGYIEEMAHNFVSSTKAQFGWEMVGWSIGAKVSTQVADNPVLSKALEQTRQVQAKTFQRYLALDCTFPDDIPANLVDRIHAHLLWQCEKQYGPNLWHDFFRQIDMHKLELENAVKLIDDDAVRNERYRITVDCFNHLKGINFREKLAKAGISLNVDIKSLHPTQDGWNRKLH